MELVAAARSGRTNDVRRLLDEGSRVDDEGEAGGSPLWCACAGGHYQCAKLLLLRGAAVDRERDGTTPLLVACQNGRLDVCELLIERGASISTPTTTGLSALNTAARGGHADIVALLLARGFSRGAETAFAREIAKIHGHTDVVELLDAFARGDPPPPPPKSPVVDITVDRVEVSSPPSGVAGPTPADELAGAMGLCGSPTNNDSDGPPSRSNSPATLPGALAGAIDFFGCGSPQEVVDADDAPASPPPRARQSDAPASPPSPGTTSSASASPTRRRWPSVQVDSDEEDYAPPAGQLHHRLKPIAEETSLLPPLALKDPGTSCREELERLEARGSIPSGLVGDCLRRTGELRLDTPVLLDDDELLALVAYTYDNQSGSPDGQFYQEVNRALRNRRGRRELVQRWGGVLYYLMAALTRLPDVSGLFFRVAPDRLQLSNYPVGGRVQYGASLSGVPRGAFIVAHTPSTRLSLTARFPHRFFSVTADHATAKATADTATDVILRLRLKHGRAVEDYSCFPDTQEVVASARARFVVASGPRVVDGYTYVDLVEESREDF